MTTRTAPMSQRRYRKEGGAHCPFCGSTQVSGGSVEIDAGHAYQEVSCNDCGRTRLDTYNLVGYEVVE